jgi:flagellar motility protein MotE (MotC chaperone)
MIKRLFLAIALLLAINFLAIAGGVGWLWKGGKLGKDQVAQIKEILFPPPPKAEEVKLEEESVDATTQPSVKLEELLAKASGRTAVEQVEFLQQAFDAQRNELDRRYRELQDLQRQVDIAKQKLADDRTAHEAKEKQLASQQQVQTKQTDDKGFQDSLALYQSMPSKQVKSVFMGLDDETLVRYLQAMQPRQASRIIKEFKTPDETARIQRVLEKMRNSQASAGN